MRSTIALFPLAHGLFPDGMLSLQIFEVRYLDLMKRCHQQQLLFGVAWLKQGSEVQVAGQTPLLHAYGCMANIRKFEQVRPNLYRVRCQGGARFQLHATQAGPLGVWQGDVSLLPNDPEVALPEPLQPLASRLGQAIASAQQQGQSHRLPVLPPYLLDECGWVANRYAEAMNIDTEVKQALLSEMDPLKRLQKVASLMAAD